jgi:hypothetical protein
MAEVVLAVEVVDEATKITNALPRKSKLKIRMLGNLTMPRTKTPQTQREETPVGILYSVILK